MNPVEYIKSKFGASATIAYMPNGGNLGDALIAAATLQAFDEGNIPWRIMLGGKENLKPNDVLVYGGGGALVDLYDGGIACIKFLISLDRPILILPHTIRGHENFWRTAPSMDVFCRDFESLEYVRRFPQLSSLFYDDMATGLDMSKAPYRAISEYRHAAYSKNLILNDRVFFRIDQEMTRDVADDSSIDISAIAHPSMKSREDIETHAVFFLTSLAHSKSITTNRLHVGVAGGLLGIPTYLHDNIYGKNKAIYEATLKKKFPLVTFQGAP